jgi:hypothetical protein
MSGSALAIDKVEVLVLYSCQQTNKFTRIRYEVLKQNMDCAALDNMNQVSGTKKKVLYSCQQTKYGLCST